MLEKIISGGQTGADQAALDAALKFNIEHGGWIPKGRLTEKGRLPDRYTMDEMESASYPARTRKNVVDSDATLIISGHHLTGGSLLTQKTAKELDKPCCHIDYISMDDFEAAMFLHSFVVDNHVGVLNVAGPRISNDKAIYTNTRNIIESLIYMVELADGGGIQNFEYLFFEKESSINSKAVKSMDEIVKLLAARVTLKTKTEIAALDDSKIASLYFELSDFIMDNFVFNTGNKALFKEYIKKEGKNMSDFFLAGDFVMAVVKKFKKMLEQTHLLRVVK